MAAAYPICMTYSEMILQVHKSNNWFWQHCLNVASFMTHCITISSALTQQYFTMIPVNNTILPWHQSWHIVLPFLPPWHNSIYHGNCSDTTLSYHDICHDTLYCHFFHPDTTVFTWYLPWHNTVLPWRLSWHTVLPLPLPLDTTISYYGICPDTTVFHHGISHNRLY